MLGDEGFLSSGTVTEKFEKFCRLTEQGVEVLLFI